MGERPKRRHTLKWYQQTYGLPEQTVVNAHRRGWPLDDPLTLLHKFMNAPGRKTAGLQPLIDYVNGQAGPSTVKPEQPQNAPERSVDAEHGTERPEQDEPPDAFVRLELRIGPLVLAQMITAAEAEQVFWLNDRSWPLNGTN